LVTVQSTCVVPRGNSEGALFVIEVIGIAHFDEGVITGGCKLQAALHPGTFGTTLVSLGGVTSGPGNFLSSDGSANDLTLTAPGLGKQGEHNVFCPIEIPGRRMRQPMQNAIRILAANEVSDFMFVVFIFLALMFDNDLM
jgi:hypothetical protein